MDSDGLLDDEAIGDELADGLAGVGVGDLVDLVRIEPDLALAAVGDAGSQALLGTEVDPTGAIVLAILRAGASRGQTLRMRAVRGFGSRRAPVERRCDGIVVVYVSCTYRTYILTAFWRWSVVVGRKGAALLTKSSSRRKDFDEKVRRSNAWQATPMLD